MRDGMIAVNPTIDRSFRQVAIELHMEQQLHELTRRRLKSCRKSLAAAATMASVFALVSVILWLRGAV